MPTGFYGSKHFLKSKDRIFQTDAGISEIFQSDDPAGLSVFLSVSEKINLSQYLRFP